MSEMRFGIAIRPFVTSANDQTVESERTEPTSTAIIHSQRYGLITFVPRRYSAAFSPKYDHPRIVENTNVNKPSVRMVGPTIWKSENAVRVSAVPFRPLAHSPELTSTSPVIAHTTTVSQNVAVEETSAWRTDFWFALRRQQSVRCRGQIHLR